jgi:hypothetical protein
MGFLATGTQVIGVNMTMTPKYNGMYAIVIEDLGIVRFSRGIDGYLVLNQHLVRVEWANGDTGLGPRKYVKPIEPPTDVLKLIKEKEHVE